VSSADRRPWPPAVQAGSVGTLQAAARAALLATFSGCAMVVFTNSSSDPFWAPGALQVASGKQARELARSTSLLNAVREFVRQQYVTRSCCRGELSGGKYDVIADRIRACAQYAPSNRAETSAGSSSWMRTPPKSRLNLGSKNARVAS
jgi:hypothetical protein